VLGTSDQEPVAAGDPKLGSFGQPFSRAAEPCAWLLELGAEARRTEFRSNWHGSQHRYLLAWSSQRTGARARRRIVEQALALAELALPVPAAFVDTAASAPVAERIGAYIRLPEVVDRRPVRTP
jgi:hypothetical protein